MEQQIKSYADPAAVKTDADKLAADGWFVHSMLSETRPLQEKKNYKQEINWYNSSDSEWNKCLRKKDRGWLAHSFSSNGGGQGWWVIWHKWESSDNILVTYRRKE